MCDFDKDGANRAGGAINQPGGGWDMPPLLNRPWEQKAKDIMGCDVSKPTKPIKRIRPRNGMKIYGTFEVVDESEHHYICRRDFELRAYAKEDWEEVPKRVVWRDVTKEVKDICFVHGKETVCSVIDPEFEITIKRRFEVEG